MHTLVDFLEDLALPTSTMEPLYFRVSEIPSDISNPTSISVQGCVIPIGDDPAELDWEEATWVDSKTIKYEITGEEKGRYRLFLRFNVSETVRPVRNICTIIFT